MKERPMNFSDADMRAIREDRKTQTRRIIKPQPVYVAHEDEGGHVEWSCPKYKSLQVDDFEDLANYAPVRPGDLIWCREATRTGANLDKLSYSKIKEQCRDAGYIIGLCCPLKYEADGVIVRFGDNDLEDFGDWGRYRQARFMPRWACRETLRVLSVRPERLQDITEADAIAEGIEQDGVTPGSMYPPRVEFRNLWDSIHAKRGYPWESSPWMWRYEFERVK